MAGEQTGDGHVLMSAEDLAAGIDQTSPEWRMAYSLADEDYAQRRRLAQVQRRAAFRRRLREHRRGTLRFLALFTVLLLTALITALAMFRVLFWVLE